MKVLRRMGKDSASSAQSKCRGGGIEHGSTELNKLLTGDGGHKMVVVRGPDMLVSEEGSRVGETARFRLSGGKLGDIGILVGVDGV